MNGLQLWKEKKTKPKILRRRRKKNQLSSIWKWTKMIIKSKPISVKSFKLWSWFSSMVPQSFRPIKIGVNLFTNFHFLKFVFYIQEPKHLCTYQFQIMWQCDTHSKRLLMEVILSFSNFQLWKRFHGESHPKREQSRLLITFLFCYRLLDQ